MVEHGYLRFFGDMNSWNNIVDRIRCDVHIVAYNKIE